jgi:hypothetical protein
MRIVQASGAGRARRELAFDAPGPRAWWRSPCCTRAPRPWPTCWLHPASWLSAPETPLPGGLLPLIRAWDRRDRARFVRLVLAEVRRELDRRQQ